MTGPHGTLAQTGEGRRTPPASTRAPHSQAVSGLGPCHPRPRAQSLRTDTEKAPEPQNPGRGHQSHYSAGHEPRSAAGRGAGHTPRPPPLWAQGTSPAINLCTSQKALRSPGPRLPLGSHYLGVSDSDPGHRTELSPHALDLRGQAVRPLFQPKAGPQSHCWSLSPPVELRRGLGAQHDHQGSQFQGLCPGTPGQDRIPCWTAVRLSSARLLVEPSPLMTALTSSREDEHEPRVLRARRYAPRGVGRVAPACSAPDAVLLEGLGRVAPRAPRPTLCSSRG